MQLSDIKEIISDNQNRSFEKTTPRDLSIECVPESACAITGARRCGKTYRSYQFIQELLAHGCARESVCRIQFNDLRLSRMHAQDLRNIDTAYYSIYPTAREKGPVYFVFDEIHRIDGWEDYVLYLLDDPRHRVLITGSTSKLLTGDIASALRGKCRARELFGFSFREFLRHLEIAVDTVSASGKAMMRHIFDRYLSQGSYPELFRYDPQRYLEVLQEYWQTMLLKDVIEAHPHERINFKTLSYFAQSLVSRTARPFTVRKLLDELHQAGLGCSPPTAYAFLRYLQEAFALDTVSVFTESTRVRQRNYQKVYARDWALAEAVSVTAPPGSSRKLEAMVFTELKRRSNVVHYLATGQGGEIDFIVRHRTGASCELIQVCQELTEENSARELSPLPDACRSVGTGRALVITLWEERETVVDGIPLRIVPAWKWLLE